MHSTSCSCHLKAELEVLLDSAHSVAPCSLFCLWRRSPVFSSRTSSLARGIHIPFALPLCCSPQFLLSFAQKATALRSCFPRSNANKVILPCPFAYRSRSLLPSIRTALLAYESARHSGYRPGSPCVVFPAALFAFRGTPTFAARSSSLLDFSVSHFVTLLVVLSLAY